MKYNSKVLKFIFFTILVMGFLSPLRAQEKIELTDIKVNNLDKRTTVNINTTRPVKFLFYKIDNPPGLVIDFIGINIYSQQPERIIYKYSRIREIQSIYYDAESSNFQPKLDSLILSFAPNVEISVIGSQNGIVLNIQQHQAVAKKEGAFKIIKAKALAQKIAYQKKLAFQKNKKMTEVAKKEVTEIEKKKEEIPFIDNLAALSDKTYTIDRHNDSIKKELDEVSNQQIVSATKDTNYNWFVLAIVVSAAVASAALIKLINSTVKIEDKENEYDVELAELDDFFNEHRDFQPNQTDQRNSDIDDVLNKCIEKRKFARFDIPQDNERSIRIDLETGGLEKVTTQAKNLSLGGIGIELRRDIKIPYILQVGLKLPDSPEINYVLTTVSWSKEKNEDIRAYGMSFMMLTESEEKNIHKYLIDNF